MSPSQEPNELSVSRSEWSEGAFRFLCTFSVSRGGAASGVRPHTHRFRAVSEASLNFFQPARLPPFRNTTRHILRRVTGVRQKGARVAVSAHSVVISLGSESHLLRRIQSSSSHLCPPPPPLPPAFLKGRRGEGEGGSEIMPFERTATVRRSPTARAAKGTRASRCRILQSRAPYGEGVYSPRRPQSGTVTVLWGDSWPPPYSAASRRQFRGGSPTVPTLSQTGPRNESIGPQYAFEMSMFMCPAVHIATRS